MKTRPSLLLWLLLFAGCGAGEPTETRAAAAVALPPLRTPELAEVRAALESGRADIARTLLERVPGFEADLLRARAELLHGDAVAALAALESARSLAPDHPELASTEAEILASLGRLPGAAEVLARGIERSGAHPALLRARGVLELHNPGHAALALEALERARAADPGLPFLSENLAQAHVLVGRARLEKDPAQAEVHARAALVLQPALLDARELQAEALTGQLRYEEGIAIYEELERSGRSFGELLATLHQRCATRDLLEHDREGAVRHYLAARALGFGPDELGFGVEILGEELRAALERGLRACDEERWKEACSELEHALELEPGRQDAENHLALARFRLGDFAGAARAWQNVLDRATESGEELADPVPIDLAKAWRLAGDRERARAALNALLDRDPDGPWSEAARSLLLDLEAEELVDR